MSFNFFKKFCNTKIVTRITKVSKMKKEYSGLFKKNEFLNYRFIYNYDFQQLGDHSIKDKNMTVNVFEFWLPKEKKEENNFIIKSNYNNSFDIKDNFMKFKSDSLENSRFNSKWETISNDPILLRKFLTIWS